MEIEINHVIAHNLIVRLATGNVLLTETSVVFSIDPDSYQQNTAMDNSDHASDCIPQKKLQVVASFFLATHAPTIVTVLP